MKKLLISTLLILSMALTALVGCAPGGIDPQDDSTDVFTLDVNPGLRIRVDADNKVVSVEATNEDGEDIVASLEVDGLDYEAAVDQVIEKIFEKGYLEDTNSVLVSYEKISKEDIEEKINNKINEVFAKHQKVASIIAQDVREATAELKAFAAEMDISVGRAKLIEAIREEYPTLTKEELKNLDVNDLNIMFDGLRDEIKGEFHKHGEVLIDKYISPKNALDLALADAQLDDVELIYDFVRMDREGGKMVWEVNFAYGETEYEYEIDAINGQILEKETDEYEPFDYESAIGGLKDKFEDIFGNIIGAVKDKIISNKEALDKALEYVDAEISELDDLEIELKKDENGAVIEVELSLKNGNEYELYIEASGGKVIKAFLNGEEIDLALESHVAQ